jgi:hypothetical protein
VSILLNKGNGHYIDGIRVAQPAGLSCGTELDFNQDGIADLGYLENGISFLVQYGTGKIGAPFSAGPSTAIPQNPGYIVNCPAAGDINGDGIPDLLIPEVNSASGSTILYPFFGAGGGNFTVGASITISESNSSILLADVNGDGKADLITPATDQLWYGNGDGTFQAPLQLASGLPGGIKSVAAADLNGDGVTDLVVQVEQEQSILLLSNGSGGLVQSTMADCSEHGVCYYSKYVAVGDINGDGFPDIVLGTTGDQDALVLFLNDGNGTFSFSQQVNVLALSGAVVPQVIDVNGDGLMDVVVADGVDISVVSNLGNAEFRPPVYFGEVYDYAPYYFGNWHGQKENSGLPDIAMPTSGYVTMLLNQAN